MSSAENGKLAGVNQYTRDTARRYLAGIKGCSADDLGQAHPTAPFVRVYTMDGFISWDDLRRIQIGVPPEREA